MNLTTSINKIKGFILLKGGKIYDPFESIDRKNDILIKDGKIVKIGKNILLKNNYNIIDCKNKISNSYY